MHLADDDDFTMLIATGTNPANGNSMELQLQRRDGVTRLVTKGTVVDDIDFDSGTPMCAAVESSSIRNVVEVFLTMAKRPAVSAIRWCDGDGEFRFVADGKADCVDVRVLDSTWR